MKHSESIVKITAAILAVQKAMKPIVKNSTAEIQGKRYSYVSIGELLKEVFPVLQDNELIVIQGGDGSKQPGTLDMETTIIHSSGEFISGTFTIPYGGNDPQKAGSAITYARRYGLAALLGIVSDEDDDGALASAVEKPAEKRTAPKSAPKPVVKKATEKPKAKTEERSSEELKAGAVKQIKEFLGKKQDKAIDLTEKEIKDMDERVEISLKYAQDMKERGNMTDTDFRNVQDLSKVYFSE